jgi:diphthine-ammonia ligase
MNPISDGYAVMWSGGKDSCLALHRAKSAGLPVNAAINFFDIETDRIRFHAFGKQVIGAQARSLGLELVQTGTHADDYEAIVLQTLRNLRRCGCRGVIFGNIHLADVRASCEALCQAAELEHHEPLWGEPPRRLLGEFVEAGFNAVVTCCQLARIGKGWLGRDVNRSFIEDIAQLGIDPCGENGEYHTCATGGPLFRDSLKFHLGETRIGGQFAQIDIVLD